MPRIVIPSMAEINALAGTNGYNVISTFSGVGGSSMGYKLAGFNVRAALEFIPEAAECYRVNHPATPVLVKDVRDTTGQELLDLAGIAQGELDLLDGSPPCKSFATGGLRQKAWGQEKWYSGETMQRSDDLFFEFARLIREMQPKVFIAENVRGLVSGIAQGYYAEFHDAMQAAGYTISNRVIDAQQLGVPQSRVRLIIMGVRNDLVAKFGVLPSFPKPEYSRWFDKESKMDPTKPKPITLMEAWEGLDPPDPDASPKQCNWFKPGQKTHEAWEKTDMYWDSGIMVNTYKKYWGVHARYHWFRQRPDRPSVTVTATVPSLMHWEYPRTYTIPEIIRLQTFPDDFQVEGTYLQRYERIGRSVPPLMMKKIAEKARDNILRKIDERSLR